MIFVVLGALVVGLSLGLCGSGGSILTVPVLRYLLHHLEKTAIAESLGIVCGIALISAIPYARRRIVNWRSVLLFGLPGMAGTYAGAWAARWIPGATQLMLFALVMLWAAILMWRRRARASQLVGSPPLARPAARMAAEGIGAGALTGVVGVGGGFLIIPALVVLGRLEMRAAVGTSLTIIALQSGVGFWKHLNVVGSLGLSVDWASMVTFVAVGTVGSLVGVQLNARINQGSLHRGFAVLLAAMGLLILVREATGLFRTVA